MDTTKEISWLTVLIALVGPLAACGGTESAVTKSETLDVEPEEGLTLGDILCPN